jgi:hyperosmotically inducible periplasmic protein
MTANHLLLTTPYRIQVLVLTCSLVAMAGLSACGKKDDSQTVGQKLDSAVASTEQAAADAKAKAEASMAKAGDAMKDATQKAEASGVKTAESVARKVDDAAITASVSAEFAKDADLSAIKIDVDTKDGNVTLYGPAPTAVARDKATTLAKSIKGVVSVNNKLTVKSS